MTDTLRIKKIKSIVILIFAIISCGIILIAGLIYNGIILMNNPSSDSYPVRGIDVSTYQGEINWEILVANDISFAFIKATEGSSLIDPHFTFNFEEAQKSGIAVGA